MLPHQHTARFAGLLYLIVFIIGVYIYQFLRGPYVFADDYLTTVALHTHEVIASVVLGFASGGLSIAIAALLFPVFRRFNPFLARVYLAFTLVNFIGIAAEAAGVLALLEASRAFLSSTPATATIEAMGALFYEAHRWAHYSYLWLSCLPVFVLYLLLYTARLIPPVLSLFALGAVLLMASDVTLTLFGLSTPLYLLLPMGLAQLVLPLWLIIKGFSRGRPRLEA